MGTRAASQNPSRGSDRLEFRTQSTQTAQGTQKEQSLALFLRTLRPFAYFASNPSAFQQAVMVGSAGPVRDWSPPRFQRPAPGNNSAGTSRSRGAARSLADNCGSGKGQCAPISGSSQAMLRSHPGSYNSVTR